MEIENIIYSAIIGHCEELEHNQKYAGNGHHLAQKLTTMIINELNNHPESDNLKKRAKWIITAWESLSGNKRYSPKEVEEWLGSTMSPAINRLREYFSRSEKNNSATKNSG